jgi:hypothetical protein
MTIARALMQTKQKKISKIHLMKLGILIWVMLFASSPQLLSVPFSKVWRLDRASSDSIVDK